MKTDELREKYLEFFEGKGCVRRPSDVLVPRWDPSVLFTPAGMNQFKDHFLGKTKLDFTRATTCQKCLRTGDIDNVGRTPYHHTFFEMLGNFSFGDYFKREAIQWAWEFLTDKKWLGLDPARLTVTVYEDDDEAARIWQEIVGLPASKITRMGEADNFWPASAPSQGPDGVCGPCSEIFYHTPHQGEVEIWNLVFTQFNRVGEPPDNLRPLPSKNIDTGMGLERAASVMQGVDSNFHIDILRPIVEAAGEVCGVAYDPAGESGRRLRRITDHVRACTFAIHENVYPGPNKEKYVVKRLLRRAVLDGHQLGTREPFLYQLVQPVAEAMRAAYPELSETVQRVSQVIKQEEANFLGTIDAGLDRIDRLFGDMKKQNRVMVSGVEAADMYTTHGFPPELFETLAAEHNLTFDWDGFRREMEKHGQESGANQRMELFKSGPLDALKKAMDGTTFLGYETAEADCRIVGLIAQDQLCEVVDQLGDEQPLVVVLDKTPFYAESGGQVGDIGLLTGPGMEFVVLDTQKEGNFHLHRGYLREGKLELGQIVTARVDARRRDAIRRAHSATHLLHYALQKHVGGHAQQQGSKVDEDWLRFDFSNPTSLTSEQVTAVEAEVNEKMLEAAPVHWELMPLADARAAGATMLFGEKYPDVVRVVTMGDYSRELCGGTHLENTAQAGLFRIVSEESVAAGTRRITGVTGMKALEQVRRNEGVLQEVSQTLKVSAANLPQRIASLVKEVRDLKKQVAAGPKQADVGIDKLLAEAQRFGDAKVIVAEIPGGDMNQLRQIIDQLRQKASPVAVLLAAHDGDRVQLVAGVSREIQAAISAADWVKGVAGFVGGSGGGRADMAQAGGKDPGGLPKALEKARATAGDLLATAKK